MKKIVIKLANHQILDYQLAIREKNDIIHLLLITLNSILIGRYKKNRSSRLDVDYVEISIDKHSRIFVFLEKKAYSFNFPFSVREVNDESLVFFGSYRIDNICLAALQSVFYSYDFKELNLEQLYEKAEMAVLDFDLKDIDLMHMKNIINELIIFEPGYIRYDDDDERIKTNHPRYHIDICYSDQVTYKLETVSLTPNNLKEIMDRRKKPWRLVK